MGKQYDYCLAASYGNDSVALIKWAALKGLRNVAVLYNGTGWAKADWQARVEKCEEFVRELGFDPHRTSSLGMVDLVKWKRGWPRQGIQFCTEHLKIIPSLAWKETHDPEGQMICLTGKRRAESEKRKDAPEWVYDSLMNGHRTLWQPLVHHTDAERDRLLELAGFEPLPHRSDECFPCVNSNRQDILRLANEPEEIVKVREAEAAAGLNRKGMPRTMFRPAKKGGAMGIDEVIDWAKSPRGKYLAGQKSFGFDLDDDTGRDCLVGHGAWCGS